MIDREDELLTQPISLGLRLGQPAIATPATWDVPIWTGRPEVPAPVRHLPTRRTVRQFLRDELPGFLVGGGTVAAITAAIAGYLA